MGSYTGSDVASITCNHPTLGSFRFKAKGNEEFTFDFGGVRNDDSDDNVASDGTPIYKKSYKLASVEGTFMVDFSVGTEERIFPQLCSSSEDATWTYSLLDGSVYKITGQPVGDLKTSTQNATMPVKVVGRILQKI